MAAPTVQSVTETQFGTAASSFAVGMPATVNAGDLLAMFFVGFRDSEAATTLVLSPPTGWSAVYNNDINPVGADRRASALFVKDAAGTEGGGTATVTSDNDTGNGAAAQVYRITGWSGTVGDIEFDETLNQASDSPNPPSHTPSQGADDYLFIAACYNSDDDASVDSAPTNYTNLFSTISTAGTNRGCSLGTARRALTNATSDDPDSFTLSELEGWEAYTVSIPPAAAGGGVTIPPQYYHYQRMHTR